MLTTINKIRIKTSPCMIGLIITIMRAILMVKFGGHKMKKNLKSIMLGNSDFMTMKEKKMVKSVKKGGGMRHVQMSNLI